MDRQRKLHRGEWLGQLLCILLLLALMASMLLTVSSRARDAVARVEIRTASYTFTDTLTGYLFRDESVVTSRNDGVTAYVTADGEAVSRDSALAAVYNNDTGTDERGVAALLFAEIERCEAALDEVERTWQSDYVFCYDTLMRDIADGAFAQAAQGGEALGAVLERRDATSDTVVEELRARIAQCREQIAALTRNEGEPETVRATRDGVFCHSTDGYERVFDVGLVHELTPEGLSDLLRTAPDTEPTVGRVVDTAVWYLALLVPAETALSYREGETYPVSFPDRSLDLSLRVMRTVTAENGEDALLILCGESLPAALADTRQETVCIARETVSGLRVPKHAIYDGNVVYVEENGVARARTVTPICHEYGCVLIQTEGDGATLVAGDRVLLCVRRLYDGRVVS